MLNRYGAFHDIKIEKHIRSEKKENKKMIEYQMLKFVG
jgi:hypothetical protein